MRLLISTCIIISTYASTASGQNDGFAIVKNDTIYGEIKINFEGGSLTIKQDAVNRVFLQDIGVVTFLNASRDTYYTFCIEGKNIFYKALVSGNKPLLEKEGELLCVHSNQPVPIDTKRLYDLFGKKTVKEYLFVRNVSIEEREGIVDLFLHFNNFGAF